MAEMVGDREIVKQIQILIDPGTDVFETKYDDLIFKLIFEDGVKDSTGELSLESDKQLNIRFPNELQPNGIFVALDRIGETDDGKIISMFISLKTFGQIPVARRIEIQWMTKHG